MVSYLVQKIIRIIIIALFITILFVFIAPGNFISIPGFDGKWINIGIDFKKLPAIIVHSLFFGTITIGVLFLNEFLLEPVMFNILK